MVLDISVKAKLDFLDRIYKIEDDGIREFVKNAVEDAPDPFWTVSASPSQNHHPPEDKIIGGLIIHTVKAAEVAEELFRFFGVFDSIDRDIVRAAILLHDMYKMGNPWKVDGSTHREHGLICAEEIEQYKLEPYLKRKIQRCIEYHMSRWNYPTSSLIASYNPDNLELIVQLSDYIASRNNISFYPSLSIIGDE